MTFGRYTSHHLFYGIALLIIAGWLAINIRKEDIIRETALIYGAGLGIFFDEVGLLLTQFKDYWHGITYTYLVTVSLVLLNVIYFRDFWESISSEIYSFVRDKRIKFGPLNLLGLIDIIDRTDEKIPKTRSIISIFAGTILIVVGIMILEYPRFLNYWVGGAFFLTGFSYLVRVIKEPPK